MDINFKSTILVADGAPDNLMLMKELLQPRLPDMDAASALHGLRGDFLAAAGAADEARQAWRDGAAEYRPQSAPAAERMQGATILRWRRWPNRTTPAPATTCAAPSWRRTDTAGTRRALRSRYRRCDAVHRSTVPRDRRRVSRRRIGEPPMRHDPIRSTGFMAFAIGVCITIWTCLMVVDAQDAQIRSNFARDTDKVAADTTARMRTYFDMLLSLKGLFAVTGEVDRQQFERFVQQLRLAERYPGFRAIQFVRAVPGADIEAFAADVQAESGAGMPPFVVHPVVQRDDHFVIEFNEPMKGNESAFGLDRQPAVAARWCWRRATAAKSSPPAARCWCRTTPASQASSRVRRSTVRTCRSIPSNGAARPLSAWWRSCSASMT
jgi:hypothetical protein